MDLSSLMRRSNALDRVFQHSRELEKLNRQMRDWLPEELAGHCAVAHCDRHRLALVTDTPARAAKLRYMSRAILGRVKEQITPAPAKIEISIAPIQPLAELAPVKRRLSPEAAARLRSLADSMEDTKLAASLRRLASNADQ